MDLTQRQLTPEEEEQFTKEFETKCDEKQKWLTAELKNSGRYVDVGAKKLDDLDALTIAFYLHDCQSDIKLFHIGANNFTDRGLIDMLSGLQWHLNIQEMYIGNNSFTEIGIEAFIDCLDSFEQLRILSMGNCGVTDENFIQLCYQLGTLKKLQQLCVPSNNIGDYGLICLSSLLTTDSLPSLRVLHLGENKLTSFSLNSFFLALQKNSTLTVLYLNDIGLDISTVKAIANCLRRNSTLQEINLGNTGFSDSAAQILWPIIPQSQLKTLQLWSNHLTDQSIIELINLVEEHYRTIQLEYIGITDNEIQDSMLITDLLDALKQKNLIEKIVKDSKQRQHTQIQNKKQQDDSDENEHEIDMNQESIENEELELLDEGLKETNDLEATVNQKEKEIQNIDEQQIQIQNTETVESDNPLQGKLKVLKWTGEEKDNQNLIHSKLEYN